MSCRELKMSWYNHLESMGFDDIEKKSSGISVSVSWHSAEEPQEDQPSIFDDGKLNYYQWVGNKLNESRFRSETDRLIWEHHSEGLSRREIAPRIGLNDRWIGRKLEVIEGYLNDKVFTVASASYATA